MAGRYALVEFYGEGKGGSNPDFPSYSEGEVVEDEVSRGPAQWSVLGLGATRPQKLARRDPRNLKGKGRTEVFLLLHPMPPISVRILHLPLMRVTCVTCVTCFNMRVTCAVHLLRRVGLAAAPRARLTFSSFHF